MKKIKIFTVFLLGFLMLGSGIVQAMPPHSDWEEAIKAGTMIVPDHNLNIKDTPTGVDFSKIQKSAQGVQNLRTLVLLVDFPDKPAQVNPAFFNNLVFGTSASNTVREFYRENSYGQLDLVTVNMPSTLGWKRASQNYGYYVGTGYGLGSYPQNSQKLTEELVELVDPFVNFAEYDNDGNGFVDGIVIVHAGSGQEFGPDNGIDDIWSHKWGISPVTKDGVRVSAYSIQPEYWLNPATLQSGNIYSGDMTIGVYAHEIGHLFGIPDLYDIDNSSRGIGRWSLMAHGSWNGSSNGVSGNSPSHLDAWSKSRILSAFATPQVIQGAGPIQLPAVETTPMVYRINPAGFPITQYFLLENRQKTGYDSQLPGSGLLVWHIDETKGNNTKEWYPGNTTLGNYKVALEQADGLWDMERNVDQGDVGDPFPGSTGKTALNNTTVPDLKSYSGVNSDFGISDISASGMNMMATITSLSGSPPAICGDLNGDGFINIIDVTAIIDYAFRGVIVPVGVNADLNASGFVEIFDVIEMVNHAFRGYAPPDCLSTPPASATGVVAPVTSPSVVTASSPNYKIGSNITTSDFLKVRVKPFGLVLATVPPRTSGVITGGPNTYQGYQWWKVKYPNGIEGWSAENWMTSSGQAGTDSGVSSPNQTGTN